MITIIDYGVGNLFSSVPPSVTWDWKISQPRSGRFKKSGSHHFTGRRRVWRCDCENCADPNGRAADEAKQATDHGNLPRNAALIKL